MYKTFRLFSKTLLLTTMLILTSEANADAVSVRMEAAMADCVSSNVERIGSPVSNAEQWVDVVAGVTSLSFSMVQLLGTEKNEDFREAMVARTSNTLISTLEDKGFKGFRSQAIETVTYCMPFALVAAAEEVERQKSAVCPDDTDYVEAVDIITATDSQLRRRYGDSAETVLSLQSSMIELELLNFSEIFRYGKDEYPEFDGSGAIQQVHDTLRKIELKNVADIRPLVDQAMDGVRDVSDKSERIRALERELTCIKDWLDIYPADEIARLSGDD